MLRSTREPPATTTQARRSSPSWRSVRTSREGLWLSGRSCNSLNVLLAGDRYDKGTAGADGAHGERVQSRHPSHHLLSAAGLFSSDSARPAAAGDQEEEECHPEVRVASIKDFLICDAH